MDTSTPQTLKQILQSDMVILMQIKIVPKRKRASWKTDTNVTLLKLFQASSGVNTVALITPRFLIG